MQHEDADGSTEVKTADEPRSLDAPAPSRPSMPPPSCLAPQPATSPVVAEAESLAAPPVAADQIAVAPRTTERSSLLSDQRSKYVVGACAAVVVGGLGPWATAFGALSVNGTAGDGISFVVLGLLTAALWLVSPPIGTKRRVAVMVCGALVVLVGVIDGVSIMGNEFVSLSWGIVIGTLGGVALVVSARKSDARPPRRGN